MRHHRRADDAEREIEHVGILDDLDGRREAADHLAPIGIGHGDLNAEADGDDQEQRHHERLDITEAELLHPQDQKHVERGEQHADLERNAEQEIEPDRRADHLGQIGGADGELGERPERNGDIAREGVAAGLRQVAARGDAEPDAERLQHDRHQVRQQRDGQQRVAELRAAGERGRPVAGVHVADGDQIAGAEKCQQLPPQRAGGARPDRAEHFGERGRAAWAPPAAIVIVLERGLGRHRAERRRTCLVGRLMRAQHADPSIRERNPKARKKRPLTDRRMLYVS